MGKKLTQEFPAQMENRKQWILDTVRANQWETIELIWWVIGGDFDKAKRLLANMHKQDKDALLQPGGVLTTDQIELLKE